MVIVGAASGGAQEGLQVGGDLRALLFGAMLFAQHAIQFQAG